MPLEFVIERAVAAPVDYVHHWWLENGPMFEREVADGVRQERVAQDPLRFTVRRWTTQGHRAVYVESRVCIDAIDAWSSEKSTSVDGVPFTTETVRFSLHAHAPGCLLRVAFSIVAPTRARQWLLGISKGRIAGHRGLEIDRALNRLERERSAPP